MSDGFDVHFTDWLMGPGPMFGESDEDRDDVETIKILTDAIFAPERRKRISVHAKKICPNKGDRDE